MKAHCAMRGYADASGTCAARAGKKQKPGTGEPTAHALARYRCFLPDLAGLAGLRRAGPMPDKRIVPDGFRHPPATLVTIGIPRFAPNDNGALRAALLRP